MDKNSFALLSFIPKSKFRPIMITALPGTDPQRIIYLIQKNRSLEFYQMEFQKNLLLYEFKLLNKDFVSKHSVSFYNTGTKNGLILNVFMLLSKQNKILLSRFAISNVSTEFKRTQILSLHYENSHKLLKARIQALTSFENSLIVCYADKSVVMYKLDFNETGITPQNVLVKQRKIIVKQKISLRNLFSRREFRRKIFFFDLNLKGNNNKNKNNGILCSLTSDGCIAVDFIGENSKNTLAKRVDNKNYKINLAGSSVYLIPNECVPKNLFQKDSLYLLVICSFSFQKPKDIQKYVYKVSIWSLQNITKINSNSYPNLKMLRNLEVNFDVSSIVFSNLKFWAVIKTLNGIKLKHLNFEDFFASIEKRPNLPLKDIMVNLNHKRFGIYNQIEWAVQKLNCLKNAGEPVKNSLSELFCLMSFSLGKDKIASVIEKTAFDVLNSTATGEVGTLMKKGYFQDNNDNSDKNCDSSLSSSQMDFLYRFLLLCGEIDKNFINERGGQRNALEGFLELLKRRVMETMECEWRVVEHHQGMNLLLRLNNEFYLLNDLYREQDTNLIRNYSIITLIETVVKDYKNLNLNINMATIISILQQNAFIILEKMEKKNINLQGFKENLSAIVSLGEIQTKEGNLLHKIALNFASKNEDSTIILKLKPQKNLKCLNFCSKKDGSFKNNNALNTAIFCFNVLKGKYEVPFVFDLLSKKSFMDEISASLLRFISFAKLECFHNCKNEAQTAFDLFKKLDFEKKKEFLMAASAFCKKEFREKTIDFLAAPSDFAFWVLYLQITDNCLETKSKFPKLKFELKNKPFDKKSDMKLHIALKAIKFASEKETESGYCKNLLSDVLAFCVAKGRINTAFLVISNFRFGREQRGVLERFLEAVYRSGDLSLLEQPFEKSEETILLLLEEMARNEDDNLFAKRVSQNRKNRSLVAVFGPFGALINQAVKKQRHNSVAQYLWEVFSKIKRSNFLPEKNKLQLMTPVLFVLSRFLEKNPVASIVCPQSNEGDLRDTIVTKKSVEKNFLLMLSKFVLINHEKGFSIKNEHNVESLSQALCQRGFVTLAFSLLAAFEKDTSLPFSEITLKCLAVQKISFTSGENNSAVPTCERLQLGYDMGTPYSRLSWSLLESLLSKFGTRKHAKIVAETLLATEFSTGRRNLGDIDLLEKARSEKNSALVQIAESVLRLRNELKGGLKFFPLFLLNMLKGNSGEDSRESDFCFSADSEIVFLLRTLTENGYLYQAADLFLCYLRNERLKFLKDKHEMWYPRDLARDLILKGIEYCAHIGEKENPKLLGRLKTLLADLEVELRMCEVVTEQ